MAIFSEKDRNVVIKLILIAYDQFFKGMLDLKKIKYRLSNAIIMEIIERFINDKEVIEEYHKGGIQGIDEYKVAGILSYWIVRLKPIMIEIDYPDSIAQYANEYLALAVVQSLYYQKYNKLPKLTAKLIKNLLYALRYDLLNGGTLSLVYESFVNGYSHGYQQNEEEKK